MKTVKSYVLVLMVLVSAAACDEDDSTPAVVSNEEAADMVATSLAEESSGMTTVVADATSAAQDALGTEGGRKASCGYSENHAVTKTNRESAIITYSYDYSYSYEMTCNTDDEPLTLVSGADFTGSFDAPRLASAHTGKSDLNISALDETATSYLVNGSYSRTGTFESRVRNKNTSTSTVLISLDEITVDKEGNEIVNGSASVSITGEVPGQGNFSLEGSIVFEGNDKATLTIDGTTYSIDLETAEVD